DGGILHVECADGSRIVINRQAAAREIWVAARSGGFHYRWDGAAWRDTRSGETLLAAIGRLLAAQCGVSLPST
ncbi:MAG: iron donor protein CyaY, partial [Thiobacillaceae bacterium]|nr:iron donor protein CyaY [Thiobacillaceae bacterium]